MKKINELEIFGRRWFQRSYGNTYHTAIVFVNGEELKSDIKYGYGSSYLQTAADLLRVNGYDVPADNNEAFHKMCEYPHDVEDVDRKKACKIRQDADGAAFRGSIPRLAFTRITGNN